MKKKNYIYILYIYKHYTLATKRSHPFEEYGFKSAGLFTNLWLVVLQGNNNFTAQFWRQTNANIALFGSQRNNYV